MHQGMTGMGRPMRGMRPGLQSAAPPFAKGGEVDVEGDSPAKKAVPHRQFGRLAETIPGAPPVKKARGGRAALTRRPRMPAVSIAIAKKKASPTIPTPPPDYDDTTPTGASMAMGPAPGMMGAAAPGMAKGGKWIQGAIKKPGALHAQLGVPQGEKIPARKLAAAAGKGGKLGQRARLAQTLKGLGKSKGGKCDDKDMKMAAGGAAKQRKGYPNTQAPPKRLAAGGTVRGCGIATKGCKFEGIY
jgi:hypothetical protein